jgi:hypothetical protein
VGEATRPIDEVIPLLANLLVGTFRLVSLEARRSDGEISHPFGRNPIGLFLFDQDGNFAVQLRSTDPVRDGANAANDFMAMFGTYRVDENRQTFTLTPDGASHGALVGTEIVRHVRFGDGVAIFNTPPQRAGGLETITYITWKKVSGDPSVRSGDRS